jgi:DNA-directed RNA polymerase specialized sigma24 family protein
LPGPWGAGTVWDSVEQGKPMLRVSEKVESGSSGGLRQRGCLRVLPCTHWTTLLLPLSEREPAAERALERLFQIYRPPILAYLALRLEPGHDVDDAAQDFVERMLWWEDLSSQPSGDSRFRTFLLVRLRQFVVRARAEDHGQPASAAAPAGMESDEAAQAEFRRLWWRAIIEEAVRRLETEWSGAGTHVSFKDLEPMLHAGQRLVAPEHSAVEAQGLSGVSISLGPMRDRYRDLVRMVVAETVLTREALEEELQAVLGTP